MSVSRRADEEQLWAAVVAGESPRDAGQRLGIRRGRVEYLCNKWATKGIYDYGVTHDLGWVVPWAFVQLIEPVERWDERSPDERQARVQVLVHVATARAVERVAVDPKSAQVSIYRETVALADPETGEPLPPAVALRMEWTPTLDSRYPTPTSRKRWSTHDPM